MNKKLLKLSALIAGTLNGGVYGDVPSNEADRAKAAGTVDPLDSVFVGGLNSPLPMWLAQHRSHASHGSHGSHRSSAGTSVPRTSVPRAVAPRIISPQPSIQQSEPLSQPSRPSQSIPQATSPPDKAKLLADTINNKAKLQNVVMRIQLTLQISGHYKGNIDGNMGGATRQAINSYRQEKGIPQSQTLDVQTLDSLGIIIF
jgi:His-Xaa-Ser repeat protein HxsA